MTGFHNQKRLSSSMLILAQKLNIAIDIVDGIDDPQPVVIL
jgi:hypothetical protein